MSEILTLLCGATGMGPTEMRRLVEGAPERYKEFPIPKRKGGFRTIAQPAREIKFLQRIFMRDFLSKLPIHDAATAYRKGYTLADNAGPHAGAGRPLLKMDLREFFPSLRSRDWGRYCRQHRLFQEDGDIRMSERLLFYRPSGGRVLRLSIGAPSSPMISNILMFDIDAQITEKVARDHVTYTRYADDLTFSAPRTGYLVNVKKIVAQTIRDTSYPKLDINRTKTTYATAKYHREVTGLILSNDGRVTIGRDRKRTISAKVHHFSMGNLEDQEIARLAGLLSYVNSVEPLFLEVLIEKYGEDALGGIFERASHLHAAGRSWKRES